MYGITFQSGPEGGKGAGSILPQCHKIVVLLCYMSDYMLHVRIEPRVHRDPWSSAVSVALRGVTLFGDRDTAAVLIDLA